jgi:hypothetical protein
VLEGGDEGQLHALAPLVAGLGGGQPVLQAEALVGVGLQPDRLDQRLARTLVGVGGRPVVDRQHALRPPGDGVEAGVGGDPVEPAPKRAAALEPGQPPPGPQQGVLEGVLGVVNRAEHAVAVGVELGSVGLDQEAVGVLVAPASPLEQRALLLG